MAQSPPNPLRGYGFPQAEPGLYDVLAAWKAQILINLNVCKLGQIVSFSYPTATVQILGQRVLKNGTTSPYPILNNVPVVTMQGGGAALQFPISPGDQCLVFFADRNIDAWYLNGGSQPPLDGRLHSLADGFALVGINWSNSQAIPSPSSSEARLIFDGAKLGLESGKITLQNSAQNLATILSSLVMALATLNTAIAGMSVSTINAGTTQAIAAGQEATIAALLADLTALLY